LPERRTFRTGLASVGILARRNAHAAVKLARAVHARDAALRADLTNIPRRLDI
jgi:hypothetical protein